MSDMITAAQMALRALELRRNNGNRAYDEQADKAINALRAALAAQQEPVAWYYIEDPWGANEWHWMTDSPESQKCDPRDWTPVYTHTTLTAQPLTDEQIHAMRSEAKADPRCIEEHWFVLFARAIERAHGIGGPNGG